MDIISPEIARIEMTDSDRDEGFIALCSKPDLNRVDYLAVMKPERGSNLSKPHMKTSHIGTDDWVGVVVEEEEATTIAAFRTDNRCAKIDTGEVTGIGHLFALQAERGQPMSYFIRGMNLSHKGQELINVRDEISAAVRFSRRMTSIEIEASKGTDIAVRVPRIPAEVRSGSDTFTDYSYDQDTGMISLKGTGKMLRLEVIYSL
jgi:hypothetical protein